MKEINDPGYTGQVIRQMLLDERARFIGRMPGTEADAVKAWLIGGEDGFKDLDAVTPAHRKEIEVNGFYAFKDYDEVLTYWLEDQHEALQHCDLIYDLGHEQYRCLIRSYHDEVHVWSAAHMHQWLPCLDGKKVLVATFLDKSVHAQWPSRGKFFQGGHTPFRYPDFDLLHLKVPHTCPGSQFPHMNWRETFGAVCGQAMDLDYDIAIVGCAAYGMPLAHFLWSTGKTVLYVGSYVHVMFGLKAPKWEAEENPIRTYWNEAWNYPFAEERPAAYMDMDGGSLWRKTR